MVGFHHRGHLTVSVLNTIYPSFPCDPLLPHPSPSCSHHNQGSDGRPVGHEEPPVPRGTSTHREEEGLGVTHHEPVLDYYRPGEFLQCDLNLPLLFLVIVGLKLGGPSSRSGEGEGGS